LLDFLILKGPCLLIDNFLILLVLPEAPGLHVLLHFAQPVQAAQVSQKIKCP